MFHAAMSASLIGFPRPGVSAAAVPANGSANTRAESKLRIDMLDPSGAVDAPAGEAVVVLVGEAQRVGHGPRSMTARGHEFGAARLHGAGFVPGAAMQHDWLAIPAPRHAEAGERLRQNRLL